jgi:uncharacterized protein
MLVVKEESMPEQIQRALVTGASSGIGAEIAAQLAARGADLVLVARREDKLRALADRLSAEHSIRAEVLALDLAVPGVAKRVRDRVDGSIDLLVNNAGFATYGPFDRIDGLRQSEEVVLNVLAPVELSYAFIDDLIAARGAIINVASTAAFQPVPYMAVYGATKAFVLSFSEALWAELGPRGVRVLALCPGATETPFFEVAGDEASVGKRASPEEVVVAALDALDAGRSYVVPGARNYVTSLLARLLPRATAARVTARVMRPRVPSRLLTT